MSNERMKELVNNILLSKNADYYFEKFVKDAKEKNIRNDGTNEFLNIIDDCISNDEDSRICSVIEEGKRLYRARIIDEYNLKNNQDIFAEYESGNIITNGFGECDSRECPLGVSKPVRNNIEGGSYIYLADRPETACVEVKPIVTDLISLAEFEIMRELKIIDFSEKKNFKNEESEKVGLSLNELFTKIMRQYYLPISNKDEYIATQILTDHIRKKGFDGIAYGSYYDRDGVNYTIFNCDRQIVRYIDSKIILLQSEEKVFLDFNDKKVMKVDSKGSKEYDERVAGCNGLLITKRNNPRLFDLE